MSSCYTDLIDSDNINYDILIGPHESSSRIDKDAIFEVCAIEFTCGITTPRIDGDVIVGISSTIENLTITDTLCVTIGQPGSCDPKINDEFCIDGGLGLTHYSSQIEEDIGLDLEPVTFMNDAFQLMDNWMKTYLMTTPPAPCFRERASCENDLQTPEYFYVEWDNIPRRCLGFLDVQVPLINEMKIDYVKSSLNVDCDFSDPSVITVSTGSTTVERFQAFTDTPDGASSGMFGATIWREFVVEPGVLYDTRIYGVNYNCDHSLKYLVVKDLCTLSVDVPSEPLNLDCSVPVAPTGREQINLSWDKPLDHDIGFPGDNEAPLLEQYAIDYDAISSVRFGGVITHSVTNQLTGNINTTASITGLNPGTLYQFDVAAKNVLNSFGGPTVGILSGSDGFGVESNTTQCTTLVPDDPPVLSTIALNNTGSLTYAGGACSLDALTAYSTVYNWHKLDPTNTDPSKQIRTDDTTINLKNNYKVGTETLITSTIFADSGLSATFTNNTASIDLDGFGNDLAVTVTNIDSNNITQLVITEDSEFYASPTDFQGFWKDWSGYAVAYDLGVTSEDIESEFYANFERVYKLRLAQDHLNAAEDPSYVSNVPSELTFVIDDLNVFPGITGCGITDVVNAGVLMVSGVPTFTTDTSFNFQFIETEIAHKFIRPDKCHATYGIYLSDETLVSDLDTVDQGDIGASHKYYVAPGATTSQQYYETSTTLHNSLGLVLAEDPGDIQFNDFEVSFSNLATNVCNDDVRLRVEGCNLFGVGEAIDCPFLDTATGEIKLLRIDTCSTTCLYDPSEGITISEYTDLGLLVQSSLDTNDTLNPDGAGTHTSSIDFPILTSTTGDGLSGDVYDADANLVTNANYIQTLQMYHGRWQNPVAIDYTQFYMPGGVIVPDYSGAVEDGEYRYVTFKYQRTAAQFDLVASDPAVTRERVRLTIVDPIGLTVDFDGFDLANHRMELKVDGHGDSPGDGNVDGYDTYWLDCTNVTQSVGIINGIVSQNNPVSSPFHDGDRVGCINGGTSTVQQRDCFIPVVTNHTATFYVRIGWPNNVDYSIGCGVFLEVITGTFSQNPTNPFLP